jgi:hypothetical protein
MPRARLDGRVSKLKSLSSKLALASVQTLDSTIKRSSRRYPRSAPGITHATWSARFASVPTSITIRLFDKESSVANA